MGPVTPQIRTISAAEPKPQLLPAHRVTCEASDSSIPPACLSSCRLSFVTCMLPPECGGVLPRLADLLGPAVRARVFRLPRQRPCSPFPGARVALSQGPREDCHGGRKTGPGET